MKWLGRALACGSWLEAETDFACNELDWKLCFKLGLLRRTCRTLRPLQHCVGSSDSLPAFRGRDSGTLHLTTLAPSAPAGRTIHGWRRERSWRLDRPKHRLCATAQCQRMAPPVERDAFFVAMPLNLRTRDPVFARRSELQLLQLQLGAFFKLGQPLPRALTIDMRGDQKAQPFGHPLDGRVRRHPGAATHHGTLCPSTRRYRFALRRR